MRNDLPLPRSWPQNVRSAMLHVVSLAFTAITHTRSWAVNSPLQRVRLAGELDRAKSEIALLREEIRIKNERMVRVPPQRRPHYPPMERMAILELRAARGWTASQAARVFLIEPATVSSWMRRLADDGESALVQLREPVNKFPEFVGTVVRRLKTLCPTMGKKRIAQTLARAGLNLSATTVGRMLQSDGTEPPEDISSDDSASGNHSDVASRSVIAKNPDHIWHVDLTIIPTAAGMWTSWFPFAQLQVWPFCWWVAVILDHYTRSVVGLRVFRKPPTSQGLCSALDYAIEQSAQRPKYIISDKGSQFWCGTYKNWCERNSIRPRFGAVGRYGSIAVIERFIRSMKCECIRAILVPFREDEIFRELDLYAAWYNKHRPNQALDGITPSDRRQSVSMKYVKTSQCHSSNKKNGSLKLSVSFLEGRRHLPIVSLRQAA